MTFIEFSTKSIDPGQSLPLATVTQHKTAIAINIGQDFLKKSIDSGQPYLWLRIGLLSIEFFDGSIDSGQPCFRRSIYPFSIESLEKRIDSGQSYLRLRICRFLKESVDSGQTFLWLSWPNTKLHFQLDSYRIITEKHWFWTVIPLAQNWCYQYNS